MKKALLILTLVVLSLTSCSKDNEYSVLEEEEEVIEEVEVSILEEVLEIRDFYASFSCQGIGNNVPEDYWSLTLGNDGLYTVTTYQGNSNPIFNGECYYKTIAVGVTISEENGILSLGDELYVQRGEEDFFGNGTYWPVMYATLFAPATGLDCRTDSTNVNFSGLDICN